jgi:hypothetical protein
MLSFTVRESVPPSPTTVTVPATESQLLPTVTALPPVPALIVRAVPLARPLTLYGMLDPVPPSMRMDPRPLYP